ncbi:hypothetical protein FSP39_019075 [Pinctada imbricata]|uniref:Tower domain-containing protein n=1 Tax=Pinctada imbricata TaxID=66713 RepID=A0AA88Y5R4_PINIB|nr:hypothetical protein FSP39_019075 [Pinctada imbricata]
MEKLPDGGCVLRSAQAEEKYQQHYQRSQQEEMEKMYHNMENMYEDREDEENCITKKSWSKKEVEHLQSGHEIYEAYKTTKQPDILEGYLSEEQIRMMMDYRRQLQDERRQKLQNEFTKAWADNDKNVKRNVVPLLKLRVLGCSRKDLDTKISMLITVWRPDQGMEHLKEGTRYRVYGLTASTARSRYTESPVQLTLARHGRFQALSLDENILDMVYEPRRPLCVADLRSGTAPYGEADIIGMVINIDHTQFTESGKIQDIVYCVDCNRDVFGVKFWGGNKAVMNSDNLAPGRILCFSNLIDRPPYRSSILPVLEWSSELSLCTQTPQGAGQRGVVTEIQGMIKAAGGCGTFLEECRRILEELLQRKEEAKQPAVTPQVNKHYMTNNQLNR